MRWQRVARVVVAVTGLGVATTLYLKTRERPVANRPPSSTIADPLATVQAGESTQFRYKDGTKQFTFEVRSSTQLADGRSVSEGAKLTLEDGTVVTADRVESRGTGKQAGTPEEFLLKKNVRFQTADGTVILADEATYTDANGQAVMPGAVSFTRGRMSGTGTGGIWERDTGVFRLLADAHVIGAPGESGGKIDAKAATLTFNRAGKAMLFDGKATITTDGELMTADRATLYLTDDNEQFRVVELRGQSRVMPAPGQTGSSAPDMRAMDIDLAFHENSQALQRAVLTRDATMVLVEGLGRRAISASTIVAETAPDGKTMTLLDARERVTVRTPARDGVPERVISASTLLATGEAKAGLTAAVFTGSVSFVERTPAARGKAAGQRTGTSQSMTLKLRGQLDAIDEAQFHQDFTFKDGDVTGEAERGVYRAAKEQLTLNSAPNSRRPPWVKSGDVKVDAIELIDVDLTTNDLHARQGVKTVTTGRADEGRGAKADGALFNDREPILGFGAEFWYTGATKRARYAGIEGKPAELHQGESRVSGQSVDLADATRDLSARGAIESVMMLGTSKDAAGSKPERTRVTAETFDYKDAERTATYTGSPAVPVVMTGVDGVTSAQHMVLTLAAETRSLARLDARTDVRLKLNEGREALADSLQYDVTLKRYTLRGQPVILRAPGQKPGLCSLSRGRVAHFPAGGGSPEFPEDPGGVETRDDVPCTGSLQK